MPPLIKGGHKVVCPRTLNYLPPPLVRTLLGVGHSWCDRGCVGAGRIAGVAENLAAEAVGVTAGARRAAEGAGPLHVEPAKLDAPLTPACHIQSISVVMSCLTPCHA